MLHVSTWISCGSAVVADSHAAYNYQMQLRVLAQITTILYSRKTLIGVHEMHGRMHPK
jgi:hypothetical protein